MRTKNLKKVRLGEAYSDQDDYMDTYYRLLRAEAFSPIQKGIKDLLAERLDSRDMDCYTNVSVAAMEVTNSALSFWGSPLKRPRRLIGKKSPSLMYGNLLCLSPNGRFDDVIWATVNSRDTEQLNKSGGIIFVEFLR